MADKGDRAESYRAKAALCRRFARQAVSAELVAALYDLAAEFESMAGRDDTGTSAVQFSHTDDLTHGPHRELRARLDKSIDILQARFDFAELQYSSEAIAALRRAADDLMRVCARILLEFEPASVARTDH